MTPPPTSRAWGWPAWLFPALFVVTAVLLVLHILAAVVRQYLLDHHLWVGVATVSEFLTNFDLNAEGALGS